MLEIIKKSLGAKIILSIAFFLFLILGLVSYLNISYINKVNELQIRQYGNLVSHTVSESLITLMLLAEQEAVQNTVETIGKEISKLSIIDSNGVIKKSSDLSSINKPFALTGFDIHEALNGKAFSAKIKGNKNKHIFTMLLPVKGEKACYKCHDSKVNYLGVIQMDLDETQAWDRLETVRNFNIVASLIGIMAILLFLLVLLKRLLLKPLKEVIISGTRLASRSGDLSQRIEITSNDEIGQLCAIFNNMVKSMQELVTQIRNNANQVSSSSQEMSSSIEQLNSAAQEISSAIQQINNGAISQTNRVETTYQVLTSSSESIKKVISDAQTASESVTQNSNSAESAKVSAQEAVDKIERLTNTVLETTRIIGDLGVMSEQIGDITETINFIADQTNLLALNAAIEAARAGEAGRGFAVVAEEVRRLAEGSAEAVKKIGSLVKSIQNRTNQAVDMIQLSSKEVQEGKLQVINISSVLTEISTAAKEASAFVYQISVVGKERVVEIERIVKSINEITLFAKESVSTTQEISATVEEQAASIEQLTSSSVVLANLAAELQTMFGKFKL